MYIRKIVGREGGGKEAQEGGDVYTYGWSMLMFDRNQHRYCKAIILQLKKKKKIVGMGTSLVVQWLGLCPPNAGLIPWLEN